MFEEGETIIKQNEPVPIETRAQTAARIKTEAAVKYDEMREESGSMRREILGLDRHHRRYFVLGDDFSRIFCGRVFNWRVDFIYSNFCNFLFFIN